MFSILFFFIFWGGGGGEGQYLQILIEFAIANMFGMTGDCSLPKLTEPKSQKFFGRPSTSSCSSKTSRFSHSSIRVQRFFERLANRNKV